MDGSVRGYGKGLYGGESALAIGFDAFDVGCRLLFFALFAVDGCFGCFCVGCSVIRRRTELGWCGKGGACFRSDRIGPGSGWRRMLWLFRGWLVELLCLRLCWRPNVAADGVGALEAVAADSGWVG